MLGDEDENCLCPVLEGLQVSFYYILAQIKIFINDYLYLANNVAQQYQFYCLVCA